MTTIRYRYEGQLYPITYSIAQNPHRVIFNDRAVEFPLQWNTMSEEDRYDWFNDPDFCQPHDVYLNDEITGEFAGILSVLIGGICTILTTEPNKLAKLHNSVCDFDTLTMTLSNGESYHLPSTGSACGMFDINTMLN